jgi:hypothetical protein
MIMLRWTGPPRRWPVVAELPGGGMSEYRQTPRRETAAFAASQALPGELPTGSGVPVPRPGLQIMCTVAGNEGFILDSEQAQAGQLSPKTPADLAGWTLSIMVTTDMAPGSAPCRSRASSTP